MTYTMKSSNKAYLNGRTCMLKDTRGNAVLHSLSKRSCKPGGLFKFMGGQVCTWTTTKTLYCPGDYLGNGQTGYTDKIDVTGSSVGEDGYQHSGPINQRNRKRTGFKNFGKFNVQCPKNANLVATPIRRGKNMKYEFYCKY